jgi:ABC-2 type transport system permease protein
VRSDLLLRRVATKTMRDQRRALVGWGVALGLLVLLQASYFPMIADQAAELEKLMESYPPAMKAFFGEMDDIASGPGYLRAQLFGLMLPLLLLVFAIARGADLVAGEEERGALDLTLSLPVSRRRVVLEKAAGLGGLILLLGLVLWLVLAPADLLFGMGVGAGRVTAGVLMVVLLAWTGGALALAAGSVRGRKGLALSVAAGVMVASYLLTGLARLVPDLEPARPLSLFHHYGNGDALVDGMPWLGALVLLAVTAALLALAAWSFERRDVGT